MRAVLLVAVREIRQVLGTRGFWVMLLIVPVALAISGFASTKLAPERSSAFTIVDRTGRYAPVLKQRLEFGYQQQTLRELSTYVDRWHLGGVDPQASWSNRQSWLSPQEVERFVAAGGADAAIARLRPHLPADAPAFEAPDRFFVAVPPPAGTVTGDQARRSTSLSPVCRAISHPNATARSLATEPSAPTTIRPESGVLMGRTTTTGRLAWRAVLWP